MHISRVARWMLAHYSRRVLCRVQLHSAKSCRHIPSRQRLLCRVFFIGHSVKIYTRQNKNAKKPKNNSNFFSKKNSREAATGQRLPVFIEVAAFFALNSRLMRPAGFELTTSPSRVYCSTTALHCHLYLDSVIYILIYYTKPRVNCLFEALNEFKSKSGNNKVS